MTRRPPFKHQVLHDIESVFWISLWLILSHSIEPQTPASLFPDSASWRELVLRTGFYARLEGLPRQFLAALEILDRFREALFIRYEEAYQNFKPGLDGQVESSAFVGAHTEFAGFLDAVLCLLPP